LAGQGGYGIQTAPAIAQLVAAQIAGIALPAELAAAGVNEAALSPARFSRNWS
jgi:D-arginine dehydrogenase